MADTELMSGEFKFLVPLAKAVEEDGKLFVEGVASDTGLDMAGERISEKGQASMARWAQKGTVVLGGEANHYMIAFDDDLGALVDGHVTDKGEFYLRSELDADNPRAVGLHTSLQKGKQLGLSVFGKITDFHDENDVPVIDGVTLTRVMVTPSPMNPRTWLSDVAKSLPVTDGGAIPGKPEPDAALETTSEEVPEDAAKGEGDDVAKWDGSASRYNSTEDYCKACLIDVNTAASKDEKAQSHCKLPIKDPGSDEYNFDGVKAAAGGYGITRVKRPDDVPEDAWDKAVKAAANVIVTQYKKNDDTAPDAVYELAGKEPPEDTGKSGRNEEVGDMGATEAGAEEPNTEPGLSDAVDAREAAKGAFLDALRREQERAQEDMPLTEQLDRLGEIDFLVGLLYSVAWDIYDRAFYEEALLPDEAAAILSEAIEEFKAEVAAKALPATTEELPAEADAPVEEGEPEANDDVSEEQTEEQSEEQAEEQPEEPSQEPTTEGGKTMAVTDGKSISEIAQMFADDHFADLQAAQVQAPASEDAQPVHPAARVAMLFTDAVKMATADEEMSPEEQRRAVALALAATMDKMEEVMPAAQADDGLDEAPPWARALVGKVEALETALARGVNVGAGSVESTSPEDTDRPTLPARKSTPPEIRASKAVEQPKTLRDIALQLMWGSSDPLVLP